MTDLNSITLVGRLTSDISERDFAYLGSGTAKLTLHIANNKSRKQGDQWIDETSFFDVLVFGKYAENLKAKVYKGMQVVISGRLQQDRWQDQTGQKKSKIYIVADTVQTFNRNQQGTQQQGYNQSMGAMQGYSQPIPPQVQQVAQTFGGEVYQQGSESFPEDLPF